MKSGSRVADSKSVRRNARQHFPTINEFEEKQSREFALPIEEYWVDSANSTDRRDHVQDGSPGQLQRKCMHGGCALPGTLAPSGDVRPRLDPCRFRSHLNPPRDPWTIAPKPTDYFPSPRKSPCQSL
jgi:hypothetical protein